MPWPKVVLFGDSLTQLAFNYGGWGAALADKLQRKCDVITRGFSGYNSTWGRIVLPRCIPKADLPHVAMVTIFFGANDATLEVTESTKYVSVDDFRGNLQDMVKYLEDGGVDPKKVIIIAPPALDDIAWSAGCEKNGGPANRKNCNTGLYAAACRRVAEDCGTGILDLWTLMQEEQNWQHFLEDGLHLSESGSRFLAGHLLEMAVSRVGHLPDQLPDWKDIDAANPEKTLLA